LRSARDLSKQIKKSDLPIKICAVCGKEMMWRKRWEKNWETIKYCSKRCRRNKQSE
jgi:hypothetical protein